MNDIIKKISSNLRVADGRCPKGHSVMTQKRKFDGQAAIALQVAVGGRSGTIYLNSFYGRFEYDSEIPLSDKDIVNLTCPECGVSLHIETICKFCNVQMFAVHLPDGGQVEACPVVGCRNHSLKIVDLDAQLARMYVDETKFQM
ncbi:MAG: hypothetical protein MUC50_23020 [Myxococcota bacterium]|jgi:hypothetical protein|nr:hypothetical protein [Myxococcota bacterium]